MKSNRLMRKFLLVATLCISSYPVDGSYAIDPVSCDPITTGPFIEAELQRAATLAKFVSLNLANDARRNPSTNPQGWYNDNYVRAQVELLMGTAHDALSQAQWVFGGAQGTAGAGIAGVSQTKIDKSQAGPDDEVIYCNVNRLSAPNEQGLVYDPDSNKNAVFNGNTKTNSDAIFRTSQVKLCGDEWQEGAPAYVFWQVDFDAARISYCGWYLKEVIATNPPDLRQLTTILQRLSAVPGSPPLWSLPQGPPGAGQAGIPSIQNFQMVDAMMTLALTHTKVADYRKFTQQDKTASGFSYRPVTWAGAVSAAKSSSSRYPSEAFMFLALDIFAYRSGFELDASGRFGAKSGSVTGVDWGNPGQSWVKAWKPPFGQPF